MLKRCSGDGSLVDDGCIQVCPNRESFLAIRCQLRIGSAIEDIFFKQTRGKNHFSAVFCSISAFMAKLKMSLRIAVYLFQECVCNAVVTDPLFFKVCIPNDGHVEQQVVQIEDREVESSACDLMLAEQPSTHCFWQSQTVKFIHCPPSLHPNSPLTVRRKSTHSNSLIECRFVLLEERLEDVLIEDTVRLTLDSEQEPRRPEADGQMRRGNKGRRALVRCEP
ncbi:hypothetical protein WR25_24859 [Diploscapter pachys]|uniref:Uncharacterized protein n=1 Tax=Diploscapter pachys TaxID=2018661 RepID=A0A2A2L483_9BILA|nr:hypothetical protein WR25_24859 [Diploscapter pachys]